MKHDDDEDLFSEEGTEKLDSPITFWFTSTLQTKYKAFDKHKKKRQIIRKIKLAAQKEIERLYTKLIDAP